MTHLCVTWLVYVWHNASIMTGLIHAWRDSSICDMTHPCVTWLIRKWYDSSTCVMCKVVCYSAYVTWLNRMGHDSFKCDAIHPHVWCRKWCAILLHKVSLPVISTYVWYDSSIRDMTHLYGTWFIHMCDIWSCVCFFCVISTYVWHDPSMCDMTRLHLT